MEPILLTPIILILLVSNLRLLNTSRMQVMIFSVAVQGFVVGMLPLVLHSGRLHLPILFITLVTSVIKGLILPRLLYRARTQAGVLREVEPFVGPTPSVFIGLLLLGISYGISRPLLTTLPEQVKWIVILSLSMVFMGLFIIISRKKALTQVIGYLTLENGIYAFGASLAVDHPLIVELGVLLDVWVGVFIMGIAIYHINREFDHIDTDKLSLLKE
ncbi:MAG: hypothetical protein SNJ78_01810 [Spirochaetales bacterium]